jgi:hypothetical protein
VVEALNGVRNLRLNPTLQAGLEEASALATKAPEALYHVISSDDDEAPLAKTTPRVEPGKTRIKARRGSTSKTKVDADADADKVLPEREAETPAVSVESSQSGLNTEPAEGSDMDVEATPAPVKPAPRRKYNKKKSAETPANIGDEESKVAPKTPAARRQTKKAADPTSAVASTSRKRRVVKDNSDVESASGMDRTGPKSKPRMTAQKRQITSQEFINNSDVESGAEPPNKKSKPSDKKTTAVTKTAEDNLESTEEGSSKTMQGALSGGSAIVKTKLKETPVDNPDTSASVPASESTAMTPRLYVQTLAAVMSRMKKAGEPLQLFANDTKVLQLFRAALKLEK